MSSGTLTNARIIWRDGVPYNLDFEDVYFSVGGGAAEAAHVFLHGNDLPARWRTCRCFTLVETGFGTGLNFLVTAAAWRDHAPPDAVLHYVSCEAFPLTLADLRRACAAWPAFADLAGELCDCYPEPVAGFHRRSLLGGRIRLTLLWGSLAERLPELVARADAWYLDGFAPKRNPAMWDDSLWPMLLQRSAAGATAASYSVAGVLKRGLQGVGFRITKRPGFGVKREMLAAELSVQPSAGVLQPWFTPPAPSGATEAIVIGAGIAGVTTAYALATRGWKVRIIEHGDGFGHGASGNAAGVVAPRLASALSGEMSLSLAAFQYTVAWLSGLAHRPGSWGWQPCGVLQLLLMQRLERIAALDLPVTLVEVVGEARAASLAGVALARGGLYFPAAGWLAPKSLCAQLVADAGIAVRWGTAVSDLRYDGSRWRLLSGDLECDRAPVVVVATAAAATALSELGGLPIVPVAGQTTQVDRAGLLRGLQLPVCGEGYVIPTSPSEALVGASYRRDDAREEREDEHRDNLAKLAGLLPSTAPPPWRISGGRVAERATVADRRPLVGAVADEAFYKATYGDLRHGRPATLYPPAGYRPGLFVSVGHGSHGLVSAPLAGEMLADYLDGSPLPLPAQLAEFVHPARFLVAALRRRRDG
jgi:tRNA 5-methylaminomethyl-2-thiouridine biosynthesis bifunctional protein